MGYGAWLSGTSQPEVLAAHARHWETREPIPAALVAKLAAARACGKAFATVEYTACALVDQALHALQAPELEGIDLAAFETQQLDKLGMPQGIVLRHRLPHFQHLFSSSAYAAAYYVYLWAEVWRRLWKESVLVVALCGARRVL
jgi:peptidyl-dipeptidase Dcp